MAKVQLKVLEKPAQPKPTISLESLIEKEFPHHSFSDKMFDAPPPAHYHAYTEMLKKMCEFSKKMRADHTAMGHIDTPWFAKKFQKLSEKDVAYGYLYIQACFHARVLVGGTVYSTEKEARERGAFIADSRLFNTILRQASINSHVDRSWAWFTEMRVRSVAPDQITYALVLDCISNSIKKGSDQVPELLQRTSLLVSMAEKDNVELNVVFYNTLIKIYSAVGDMDAILCISNMSHLANEIKQVPTMPMKMDEFTLTQVLQASSNLAPFTLTDEIFHSNMQIISIETINAYLFAMTKELSQRKDKQKRTTFFHKAISILLCKKKISYNLVTVMRVLELVRMTGHHDFGLDFYFHFGLQKDCIMFDARLCSTVATICYFRDVESGLDLFDLLLVYKKNMENFQVLDDRSVDVYLSGIEKIEAYERGIAWFVRYGRLLEKKVHEIVSADNYKRYLALKAYMNEKKSTTTEKTKNNEKTTSNEKTTNTEKTTKRY